MLSLLYLVLVVGWVWSLVEAAAISLVAAVLCFFFMPFAQIFYAIRSPSMRPPLILIAIGIIVSAVVYNV